VQTGWAVVLLISVLLLALRLVRRVAKSTGSDDPLEGANYPEPALKLDASIEAPKEVFGELESTLVADKDADRRYLRELDADAKLAERVPVSRKTLVTAVSVAVFAVVPYLHPSLRWWRLLDSDASASDTPPQAAGSPLPSASVGEARIPGATFDQQGRARDLEASDSRSPIAHGGKDGVPIAVGPAVDEEKPPRPIDDPSGKALDRYFAKLAAVETKQAGAIARVLYYGDSIVASDFVTGKLRRMMQTRFGDAGHGYAIIANAWPGWFHIDVSRKASDEWLVSTCVGPYAKDGFYGLGCASFTGRHAGVWSRFATADVDKWGRSVSRFELEYLKQPGGGAIHLVVDGQKRETIETDGAEEVAWHTVKVSDGSHNLQIESADDRPVRAFGIRMERDVPGVTLTAMGITGASVRFLDKQDDGHWKKVLRAAKPDLVCLAFGSNEIAGGFPVDEYKEGLNAVMKQVEEALPKASYMLVAPPDMASKNAAQGGSRPWVPIIVDAQKEVAAKRGWALWDQYRAMGGAGSMAAWVKSGLGAADMFHPTGIGGNLLGTMQYRALMQAFEAYKAKHR
jgi:hypothetical protein